MAGVPAPLSHSDCLCEVAWVSPYVSLMTNENLNRWSSSMSRECCYNQSSWFMWSCAALRDRGGCREGDDDEFCNNVAGRPLNRRDQRAIAQLDDVATFFFSQVFIGFRFNCFLLMKCEMKSKKLRDITILQHNCDFETFFHDHFQFAENCVKIVGESIVAGVVTPRPPSSLKRAETAYECDAIKKKRKSIFIQ